MSFQLNPDGSWKQITPQFAEFLGYTKDELHSKTVREVIHPENQKAFEESFITIRKKINNHLKTERRYIHKSGRILYVKEVMSRISKIKNQTEYIVVYLQDITDRVLTQQKLEHQVEQNKQFLEAINDGYLLIAQDGTITDVNPAYCEITGYNRDELIGISLATIRPGVSVKELRAIIKMVIAEGGREFETLHRHKSGEVVILEASTVPIDKNGEIYIGGFVRDVTARIRAKNELERSEQKFKSLFEHNPNAVYSFDLEGNFILVNKALEKLFGYSEKELKEMNFTSMISPEDQIKVSKHFQKAADGDPQMFEATGLHKNGKKVKVLVSNLPIYVDEEIVGVFGIAQDITELKETSRKLKESEERWQRLVENNPSTVIIMQNLKIKYINRAGVKLLGGDSAEEIIDTDVFNYVYEEDKELVKSRLPKIEQEKKLPPSEQRIVQLDGTVRHVIAHTVPVIFRGKEAVQTVLQDITKLKHREDELRERGKIIKQSLKEKEALLQEIHHRVKNNLAVITGLLELQAMGVDDKSVQQILRESQLRINSMAIIHEKLYQSENLSDIGIDEYITELGQTIKKSHSYLDNVKLNYDLEPMSININNAIPCALIVNELIVNCYKHAFDNETDGRIDIRLYRDNSKIILSVSDNGKGLPNNFNLEEQQSLGMTLVRTLSEQLNANLKIRSGNKQPGTEFRLEFTKDKFQEK